MAPTRQVTPVETPVSRHPIRQDHSVAASVQNGCWASCRPGASARSTCSELFVVLFGFLSPDTFLTEVTFSLIFRSGVVTCILALAFLVPLTAGVYDLSIGAVMSLSLGLVIYLSLHSGLPTPVTALVAIAAAALCGAVSGFIVVKLHVNSFIATLGVSQVLAGAVLLLSNNTQMIGDLPDYWSSFGTGDLLGVPKVVFILLLLALVMWYVLEFTPIGRYLLATGGNPEASRLAGVATDRVLWCVFIASGAISGIAGVVFSMQSGLYSSSIGPGYLFPAVAAVFLGSVPAVAAPQRVGHADRLLRARLRDPGPRPVDGLRIGVEPAGLPGRLVDHRCRRREPAGGAQAARRPGPHRPAESVA